MASRTKIVATIGPASRSLSICWGVTAIVLEELSWAERVLDVGVGWAKAHGLARSGDRTVLLRGRIADRPDMRAVLTGTIE